MNYYYKVNFQPIGNCWWANQKLNAVTMETKKNLFKTRYFSNFFKDYTIYYSTKLIDL